MNNTYKALNSILDLREQITDNLKEIESLLQIYFPSEYANAHQHWIPQILTALYNDLKWLPRGQITMQDSIDHIKDNSEISNGVYKYIKK